ncbi:MAG: type II toxin-antitoxin system YafQ family toxin [Candidatus Paceibacterota bacterium]|jgi:mRNA interferase YafQ
MFVLKTKLFERSFDRLKKSGIKLTVLEKLDFIIDLISQGNYLPESYRDHALKGEYSGYRECHIKGDILLIYKIEDNNLILLLVDIGSHSELFK